MCNTNRNEASVIVICVYGSTLGNFNHALYLLDKALLFLFKQSVELLICGDINVDYLSSSNRKQQLSLLLGTYNIMHMVDFFTRFQNCHLSATDNVFVDISRLQSYMIFPCFNALSDHDAPCLISNKSFFKTKPKNDKTKYII
jgi:hypothetical protein